MRHSIIRKSAFALLMTIALLSPSMARASFTGGDVNMNKVTNIDDVTDLIKHLLNDDPFCWYYDINLDGCLNISDVTCLINFLLTGEPDWPEYQGPPVPDNAQVFTVNGVSFAMIPVEGGTFTMGNGTSYESRPPHEVTVSGFSLGQTEVTQRLWEAVMDSNPSQGWILIPWQPVANLSWRDCQEFISRLNELTGMEFHLPTEAQWEFAARGGNLSQGYRLAGTNSFDDIWWFGNLPIFQNNPNHQLIMTTPVGLKKPNELGFYDMSGNAAEYTLDGFTFYTSDPQTDPYIPWDGVHNTGVIVRGGCITDGTFCEVWNRYTQHPGAEYQSFGFRLALGGVVESTANY
ncbi:MAG: SUMF1/EgtB/PvdO family nonheme iron enzyme [Muribaculaceae bacterium]|nr:SUMF1/EgtB/PvdO family nonheme iron enzyme [Muribaculaceae bacterium]